MLKLYWKIFLGFWLTGLLLGGGALLVNQQLQQNLTQEIAGLSPAEILNRTEFIVRRIPEDIADWQVRLAENDIHLHLKYSKKNSLSQATVSAETNAIFSQLDQEKTYEHTTFSRSQVGRKIRSTNGRDIYFLLDMPSINIYQLRKFAGQFAVQLGLALSVSAIACYILAKYLTRHLKKISAASQALAQGDLSARVERIDKGLRDELTLLAQDFNQMADSLETAMNNQRRLVRDISHELRSPLARLQIALELARKKTDISELDNIEQQANRLNEMIGQLLSLPSEQTQLDDTVDLCTLLDSILEDNQIEADEKNVSFAYQHGATEALIAANATQLHSALENIVRNAIHYTAANSVISLELDAHSYLSENTNNSFSMKYRISIRDQGSGVPAKDLPHIFEPFYRVDQARNRKTGGYGIGLAIVKRVVSSHNGTVEAHNINPGLELVVELPASNITT
jgi:two-component system sensor histidine kinase CpxA